MIELVFLGSFPDDPPLIAWPGHCEGAQEGFHRHTGFRLEPFTVANGDEHDQYYFSRGVGQIRNWFFAQETTEQQRFLTDLYSRYYEDARHLEAVTSDFAAANFSTSAPGELAAAVRTWMDAPTRLAGPIFFSLLLDMWYDELEPLSESLKDAAEARDHCGGIYDVAFKPQAERLFEATATTLGTTRESLVMLFPHEILRFLEIGETVSEAETALRREFFVTENRGGAYCIFSGEAAVIRAGEVRLVSDDGEPQTALSGLPACPGKVEAPATVIRSMDEFDQFLDGTILVAKQTAKPWEPLFERASAIVTQIGGSLSHAAKVSRELDKPCVVGVSNLLASVDSGDTLVIDAGEGTIEVRKQSGTG